MKQPCGCCSGIEIITPESDINRPGLKVLAYRVGTHATFLESMLARLSNLHLDAVGYPLQQLTTRDPSDPSIALLDAWATVADVLTFYQERIANEGFLRTATERRSILELARLVGYRLRPGVASSVFLAFTVANGFKGDIPAGTRAQSIPGTGETAQFFETSDKLAARDAWNNLKPRLTRPQVITPSGKNPGDGTPLATGADVIDTLYFQGISTNLKTGDALLLVFGDDTSATPAQQVLRFVESVDVQADQKRTEVALVQPSLAISGFLDATKVIQLFIDKAAVLFPGSDIAGSVSKTLNNLISNVQFARSGTEAANFVRGAIPPAQQSLDIAVKRGFTRLAAWAGHLLQTLRTLIELLPTLQAGRVGEGSFKFSPSTLEASPLANLYKTLDRLAAPPSLQPANPQRLLRTITQAFSPQSDVAPRLLAAFKPAAASSLYQAWANVETPGIRLESYAARVKAGLFASNYAGAPTLTQTQTKGQQGNITTTTVTTFAEPNIDTAWPTLVRGNDPLSTIALDAVYDNIKPGSWAAIERPFTDSDNPAPKITYHKIEDVQTATMDTRTGFTAKVTLLTLNPSWLSDLLDSGEIERALALPALLRDTVVYAKTELLALADEPLDTDVEGNTIELADLYDGLESGRWVIVSGNRTDIPNVSGVQASELVMIAVVNQGSQAVGCVPFPPVATPIFSEIKYNTGANTFGDRLVVGILAKGALAEINGLPDPAISNQKYCDQVELTPGVFANAYVPTPAERGGDFHDFQGLLVDPKGVPYPNGNIADAMKNDEIFAWRVSSEPVHTILTLANSLAYKYDASTVTVYGNVVKATHGQTVAEVLGNGDASQRFQTFGLHQSPLTYLPAPTPAGAESTLAVRVNEIEWHEADNLATLGPTGRGYMTRTDDADQTLVIFGNGVHGALPPTGNVNIKAVYRYGIGKPGNVKAQQISQLATHPLGVQGVINPLPATGGADRDSPDQARRNTPIAVMALDRLVSVEDYADFARTYAGIGKASAARLSDSRRQLVHVTIAGAEDIPIDVNSDLYHNLVQALHQYGDPYQPIQVAVRKVSLLIISAGIRVLADHQWETVEPQIRAALLDAFGFDRRELGQSAFQSEAVSLMQGMDGVAYVDVQVFDAVHEDITAEDLAGLAGTLGLKPYVEAGLARVNPSPPSADPSEPCQRILPAELVFLTPDIPDTLILTEISG